VRARAAAVVVLTMLLAAAAFAVLLSREEHWPSDAVEVASNYVRALQAGDDARALAFTTFTGAARDRFRTESHRQLCALSPMTVTSTHPPQTLGNRWRRWWLDRAVEPEMIIVRLENGDTPCLLAVEVRPRPDGGWKVTYFQSTAG
jgi:hypothetical protein